MSGGRLYPDRPFLAASVGVVRDGRVLLAARGRPPMERVFSLPGGLVEPGETLAEAALRELREEVGIEARITGVVGPVEIIDRDPDGRVRHHFVVVAHRAEWLAGEPASGPEALEFCWAGRGEEMPFPLTPGLPGILDLIFAAGR